MIAYLLRTIVILIPIIMIILMVCGCLYIYDKFAEEDKRINIYTDMPPNIKAYNDAVSVTSIQNTAPEFCVVIDAGHVETVALLSLKNDTPKLEVTMEVTADSNYLPKEKATYQNIKKYVKDNFGVNVHTRYIAEVKRMCGLEMGENHHKSQKENPEIKHCPPAKMMYIEDALKYFGLIGN